MNVEIVHAVNGWVIEIDGVRHDRVFNSHLDAFDFYKHHLRGEKNG